MADMWTKRLDTVDCEENLTMAKRMFDDFFLPNLPNHIQENEAEQVVGSVFHYRFVGLDVDANPPKPYSFLFCCRITEGLDKENDYRIQNQWRVYVINRHLRAGQEIIFGWDYVGRLTMKLVRVVTPRDGFLGSVVRVFDAEVGRFQFVLAPEQINKTESDVESQCSRISGPVSKEVLVLLFFPPKEDGHRVASRLKHKFCTVREQVHGSNVKAVLVSLPPKQEGRKAFHTILKLSDKEQEHEATHNPELLQKVLLDGFT